MPQLTVSDLNVRYGRVIGTHGVSFSVEAGEIFALVGSNGAGKSSAIKAILGMANYASGSITFEGENMRGLKTSEIVRRGIAISPEGRRVFGQLSVAENLRMGAFTRPRDEADARIEQIYAYFPRLKERWKQHAASLSGGEQQMLAIGRALMSKPKLFLLDEPSLGLAPIVVERIGDVLDEIRRAEQLTVILAEQNAHWAMHLASRAVIFELGRSVNTGPTDQLMQDPAVQSAYLGV
ncbi:ABC transporter ATP-binding protein [Paraburkholderia caballeronis]|uniref:Branched-chain amino acid transport system ATP-binding protein n=1 Tax=Paraburkholderia caballeronis TaxID=416943 RepID=A0A1H7WBG9_9BURK|nr:ABC transporter ATP-binding protein [Paraburkholderia caballeronis]PXW25022.1 branched-chain amino acid transport system ATP-binding protein [Paraburkholderia caballeronis]PXW92812.1 branched-chain amino acid transport system ATP-binding protein [Paraburkholderia caballeronis]RAJ86614.1 branched-chain amino acid transport system ATP-binding protein [Paraburkholderia caballeronis]TDV02348.1 branched-chain amino acid transport system ATP-binding protein [Paraburkholderia caballeronis]TDV16725